MHFSGWSDKYNEWLPYTSERIQKQWKTGDPFRLNNRIDVKDTYDRWLEASVVKVNEDTIRIHYKGYTARWEENLPFDSPRIAEIGTHSKAFGRGRRYKRQLKRQKVKEEDSDEDDEDEDTKKKNQLRERGFEDALRQINLRIHKVEGDGN